MKKHKRHSQLSGDDAELWAHVASTVKRVRLKPRVPDVAAPDEMERPVAAAAPAGKREKVAVHPPLPPVPHVKAKKAPPLADFDARKAKRIGKGQTEIEARIDLHGHTQADAHHMLTGFIRRCHARGFKMVLVITGKGRPETSRDSDTLADMMSGRSRGVLRRMVPLWLAEADLRPLVVGFTTAHVRHGGDGAMYVELRRKG
jgi:DNA-nicking Smr family endonuclease